MGQGGRGWGGGEGTNHGHALADLHSVEVHVRQLKDKKLGQATLGIVSGGEERRSPQRARRINFSTIPTSPKTVCSAKAGHSGVFLATPREPNSAITWARACENCYNLLQPKLIPGGRK